jgi:hypothetical protein
MDTKNDPPIVYCRVDKCGYTVSFYCPSCRDRHEHGHPSAWLEDPGYVVGHRTADCWSEDSPYRDGGYTVVIGEEKFSPGRR